MANAGSDTVSVIDTRTDGVAETISLKWHPNDFFGASPNALAMDVSGKTLFVCNGTQNAVAVVSFNPGKSKTLGLIPTGWFPGALSTMQNGSQSTWRTSKVSVLENAMPDGEGEINSHQYFGSVSLVRVPNRKELRRQTGIVLANYAGRRSRRLSCHRVRRFRPPGARTCR